MTTIKFSIRSKSKPAKIYVRVRDGKTLDLKVPTKWHVDPKQWDSNNGKPKIKTKTKDKSDKTEETEETKEMNKEIINIANSLHNLYDKIANSLNSGEPAIRTIEDLKDLIHSKEQVTELDMLPTRLVEYYHYHIESLKNQLALGKISNSTIKKYSVVLRILEKMEKHHKTSYKLSEVNLAFIQKFEHFSQDKMNYSPNTIGRAIKFIKTVCRSARVNGLETHLQLDAIKGYTRKSKFIILTQDELDLIAQTELEHNYQVNARDWLLISCYTGQRVSDFLRFNKSQIIFMRSANNTEDIKMIEFDQQKTKKLIKLPISAKIKQILDKREGQFPNKISDQKYNIYIKEVCKKAGLTEVVEGSKFDRITKRKINGKYEKWELVSSHIGRRSFATNYYGQIPTPMIMYATGHSTEQMLLKYIGKSNDDKALELAQYLR